MKTKIKNQDDIVFEDKNQNYGAYYLRRNYNKIVTRALFFAITLFLGVISIPLIAGMMNKGKQVKINEGCPIVMLTPPPPENTIEPPKPPELKNQEKTLAFTPPKVVLDSVDVSGDLTALMEGTKNDNIPDKTGDIIPDDIDKGNTVINDVNDYNKTWLIVEEKPEFIGGTDMLYKFLSDNIKYPQTAREADIEGTVYVQFIVEKDGSIMNVELKRDIGGGCGDEALRVVKAMPKWKAGKQNGMPVKVQYVLPVKFTLEHY